VRGSGSRPREERAPRFGAEASAGVRRRWRGSGGARRRQAGSVAAALQAGSKQMLCRWTERLQQAAGVRASGRQRRSARGASRRARGRSAGVARVAAA
jgi:hypothetical protein